MRPSTARSDVNHLEMLREGLNTPSKEQRLKLIETKDEPAEESYYDEEEDDDDEYEINEEDANERKLEILHEKLE